MNRRTFLGTLPASLLLAQTNRAAEPIRKLVLRSSWQTVNIGDIAHTPGMLALLEKYHPKTEVTLWPGGLSAEVEKLLTTRFPKLKIAKSKEDQQKALEECDFFLHGSGPGLVGRNETELARKAKKPYGFGGITLSDDELKNNRDLLSNAQFIFTRDTDSLKALEKAEIKVPKAAFGPDATFAIDLKDDEAAKALLKKFDLEAGKFLCAVPRLRWTPYWEIHPERTKPNPERSAVNEAFADRDHAKMREAIVAWVKETKQQVFLVPEMTYALPRLKPLLFDPLPDEIKKSVRIMDRYWLTAEATSVYAMSSAVISFEMHSPILAIATGTPAIHLRQPTDTRKGRMWSDIGLKSWLFEIDQSTGKEIAARLLEIGQNLEEARKTAQKARQFAQDKMAEMVKTIGA